MLTAAQCRVVAYFVDETTVCPECVLPNELNREDHPAESIIAYSADEMAGDEGLYCERCNAEIVAPTPESVTITICADILRGERDTLEKEIDSWLDSVSTVLRVRSIGIDDGD